nr:MULTISPECIES: hypothetical protein [unclassified Mesorhizobium]
MSAARGPGSAGPRLGRATFNSNDHASQHPAVIIVHGCFWHGHSCRRLPCPRSYAAYWQRKIERNMARDTAVLSALEGLGYLGIGWVRPRLHRRSPCDGQARLGRTRRARHRIGSHPPSGWPGICIGQPMVRTSACPGNQNHRRVCRRRGSRLSKFCHWLLGDRRNMRVDLSKFNL